MPAVDRDVFLVVGLTLSSGLLAASEFAMSSTRKSRLVRPEWIARVISRPIRALATIAIPFAGLLSRATERVLRLLGVGARSEPPITQEEISVLLRKGPRRASSRRGSTT